MTPASKSLASKLLVGTLWLFLLVWPMTGITPEGLEFARAAKITGSALLAAVICLLLWKLGKGANLGAGRLTASVSAAFARTPGWLWKSALLAALLAFPFISSRYGRDVAINVLVYVSLGLGLNIVVGLAGLLDLGYIAFYGVGAYTYALLSVHYQMSFWLALPLCAAFAAVAGCIIGYPTLRMRGDYLAIVTLGFGEILRLVLNNWMKLTGGPNGILGIKAPVIYWPDPENGWEFARMLIKSPLSQYYLILAIALFTVVAVRRLADSRIGRAWEAIREDETAASLMGVNTFALKLLAYAMGAVFGGLAGAFFAAKMRFVSPGSFTFIESAMVLAMVVLGGMGSIPGIVLGALALIALPEVFRDFEQYRMLVFGAAMAVMMLFRPAGLIPAKRLGRRSEEAH
ncbi:MAG: ABC transporter permease subunit [Thermodesulfobacteriota bacterium]